MSGNMTVSSDRFFSDLSRAEKEVVFSNALDKLSRADARMITHLAELMVERVKENAPKQLQFSIHGAYEVLYKMGAGMCAGVIWVNGAPVGEEVKK